MRSASRPRRYVARPWLILFRPVLRYSVTRDAHVLRFVGRSVGPVLRPNRRQRRRRRRRDQFDGVERRRVGIS
jgi:hypothetical protein